MKTNIVKQVICTIILFLLIGCSTAVNDVPTAESVTADNIELEAAPAQVPALEPEDIPVPQIEEIKKEPVKEQDTAKNYLKEFLDGAPDQYWYYDTNNGIGAIVSGEKRSSGWVFLDRKIRLFYWVPKTKEVYIYFAELTNYDIEYSKSSRGTAYKNPNPRDKELHPAFLKAEIAGDEYPLSPIDWMKKYQDQEPFKVEEFQQILKIENRPFTSDLVLHFQNDDGTVTTMKFDAKKHVPIMVEIKKGGEYRHWAKYYYDTIWYDVESDYMMKGPITDDLTTLPENHVVITVEEAKQLRYEKRNLPEPELQIAWIMDLFQEVSYIKHSTI